MIPVPSIKIEFSGSQFDRKSPANMFTNRFYSNVNSRVAHSSQYINSDMSASKVLSKNFDDILPAHKIMK